MLNFSVTLFGIPLLFWGAGCLAVAVVYSRLWPQPDPRRPVPRTALQYGVLRYGHALVWLLLAAACFLAAAGYTTISLGLALTSLPLYIVFLVMLVQDRQRELAALAAQRKTKQGTQNDAV